MDETLSQIEKFHGHLGPFAVIGYKMGKIARKKLGENPFDLKAISMTGTKPPISCIIDGLQLSSGCTLGKGNITVRNEKTPAVLFSNKNGENVKITLNKKIWEEIETTVNDENIIQFSEEIYRKSDSELLDIEY